MVTIWSCNEQNCIQIKCQLIRGVISRHFYYTSSLLSDSEAVALDVATAADDVTASAGSYRTRWGLASKAGMRSHGEQSG